MNISLQLFKELTNVPDTTAATVFTNASGQNALIQKITFTNNSTTAVNLSVWWVPSGGAKGNGNLIVNDVTIAPKGPTGDGVYECFALEGHILALGDFLEALSSAANQINMAISGAYVS